MIRKATVEDIRDIISIIDEARETIVETSALTLIAITLSCNIS
jgi:N-acetylglutamate synthase-like GNAT family acetyltransferase